MHLARTALAVGYILCYFVVKGQENVTKTEEDVEDKANETKASDFKNISEAEEQEVKDDSLIDNHSFVALIDIVFTDESKRTCTGAIIHDNVVITAAHCFQSKPNILPELTASFVVIGTRVMFETGYEQYLPIERVITHPMFKGWTADLSLVYTFAGMTSDKPGSIIPLSGDKVTMHVDTNITVLSWGQLRNFNNNKYTIQDYDQTEPSTLAENDGSRESRQSNTENTSGNENEDTEMQTPKTQSHNKYNMMNKEVTKFYKRMTIRKRPGQVKNRPGGNRNPIVNQQEHPRPRPQLVNQHHERYDRALMSNITTESSSESDSAEDDLHIVEDKPKPLNYKKYYSNWRRQMGVQDNKLTADTFVVVNMKLCKKLVQNAIPGYDFSKNNDILCYRTTSENQIGDEDAGALAMRFHRLVAVTIGAAHHEGENIAIGLKMTCYCSWIMENLPKNSKTYNKCCKDCCGVAHVMKKPHFKKKYLHKFI